MRPAQKASGIVPRGATTRTQSVLERAEELEIELAVAAGDLDQQLVLLEAFAKTDAADDSFHSSLKLFKPFVTSKRRRPETTDIARIANERFSVPLTTLFRRSLNEPETENDTCRALIDALVKLDTPATRAALVDALLIPKIGVGRVMALIKALAQTPDPRIDQRLEQILEACLKNQKNASAEVVALGLLAFTTYVARRGPSSHAMVLQYLAESGLDVPEWKAAACRAARETRCNEASRFLTAILSDPRWVRYSETTGAAAAALVRLDPKQASAILPRCWEDLEKCGVSASEPRGAHDSSMLAAILAGLLMLKPQEPTLQAAARTILEGVIAKPLTVDSAQAAINVLDGIEGGRIESLARLAERFLHLHDDGDPALTALRKKLKWLAAQCCV